eukprot:CAMPEP_0172159490 /NCGR_PEP_ID=MMETSP1050-20130122/4997_1 /TAXON_ID=233186 /ORGANISM="Cryptomonas curvata, Strain CCAP979/52" /LENGTH=180 /DNA_ID=CAMNT_0012829079 /DNA_START=17 /DNA_END=559 /DNA_ORIENTATION=+
MELVVVSRQSPRDKRCLRLRRAVLPAVVCSLLIVLIFRMRSGEEPDIDNDNVDRELAISQLFEDPNNYTLVEQAIREQTTLPGAAPSSHKIPEDIEKHMEAIAKIQESPDEKIDFNLTMPDNIKNLLGEIEKMKHGNITDHVLAHVNITGKVKPIPLEIVAGAKQAENEMVADDVVNSSP